MALLGLVVVNTLIVRIMKHNRRRMISLNNSGAMLYRLSVTEPHAILRLQTEMTVTTVSLAWFWLQNHEIFPTPSDPASGNAGRFNLHQCLILTKTEIHRERAGSSEHSHAVPPVDEMLTSHSSMPAFLAPIFCTLHSTISPEINYP